MPDRKVKFKVTADGDANGIADKGVIQQLLNDPTKMRVGIVIFNAPRTDVDLDKDTETIEVRIRRIEGILSDELGDASALERLLTRATERRTGETVLSTDLEDEVRAAFDGLSTDATAEPDDD